MKNKTSFPGIRFGRGRSRCGRRRQRLVVCALAVLLTMASIVNPLDLTAQAQSNKAGSGPGPASWAGDLTPITKADWNYARAGHLLERAGFGGTPEEIERLARMTPQAAVNYLVDYESIRNDLPPFEESGIFDEAMVKDVDLRYDVFGDGVRAGYQGKEVYGVKANPGGVRRLQPVINQLYYRIYCETTEWQRAQLWLINRMVNTRRPLEEKLLLFWHGHFATEDAKVSDYRLMLGQFEMLRSNGAGNFRDLLVGIGKDPAMLVYLDNRKNIKGQANENFAREIMELFALGVGSYTETDIKEAARAFTGWANVGPKFIYKPELHDDGEKVVLGEKGNFDGEQVIDIILKQKAAAEFITRKLYRFLVREEITPELNAKLAARLRADKYEFKPLLKTIFLSKDFYSPASYATQIKSPTQLVVSTYRKLGMTEVPGLPFLPQIMGSLGQSIGNPPNVKGWDGGRSWINPATMLQRANFARLLMIPEEAEMSYAGRQMPERYVNAIKEAEGRDQQARQMTAGAENMVMAASPPKSSAQLINSVPDYDLKLGVYNGYTKAFARVKPVPRTTARIDLTAMARSAGVKTADEMVDYFIKRFLRSPLEKGDRAALVDFLKGQWGGTQINFGAENLEQSLRALAHLIMSAPEYQLS